MHLLCIFVRISLLLLNYVKRSRPWGFPAPDELQALIVGTEVVVQPVCSRIDIQAVSGRRPRVWRPARLKS